MVLGAGVNLDPVTLTFALMAGGVLFGFLGLLFAVPLAGALKTIFVVLIRKDQHTSPPDKPIIL